MTNFSDISSKYEDDSVVQKTASEVLFDMLDIQPNEDVLDLGCGTGHISRDIREKTNGKVVAVDPSKGMIEKAIKENSGQEISFRVCSAETLDYENEFDVVFCNSAFQWFVDPPGALKACFRALKSKGRMAIQAPAKEEYCPNFIQAVEEIKKNRETKEIFSHFDSPWFFHDTPEEYARLFAGAGFNVECSMIDEIVTHHPPDEVLRIFESGAAAGYLNQDCYDTQFPSQYVDVFRRVIKDSFMAQADRTGQVRLVFYRIYLLGKKRNRRK